MTLARCAREKREQRAVTFCRHRRPPGLRRPGDRDANDRQPWQVGQREGKDEGRAPRDGAPGRSRRRGSASKQPSRSIPAQPERGDQAAEIERVRGGEDGKVEGGHSRGARPLQQGIEREERDDHEQGRERVWPEFLGISNMKRRDREERGGAESGEAAGAASDQNAERRESSSSPKRRRAVCERRRKGWRTRRTGRSR